MSSLQNLQISQTFPGLIKTNNEAAIDGTLRTLQDGAGNNLPMEVSTTGVKFTDDFNLDHASFDTASTHIVLTGEQAWNSASGTFDLGLLNGVVLQTGQEMHIYGKANGVIANGDVVQFAGAQGSNLLLKSAVQAEIDVNPEYVIGVATQDFANNQFGYITSYGNVRGLNTQAYTVGTILWYDSDGTTPGALTNIEPSNGSKKLQMAAVTNSGPNGDIFVREVLIKNMDEIGDVEITGLTNGQVLSYNSTTGQWVNTTPGGGGTNTTYDLTKSYIGNALSINLVGSDATTDSVGISPGTGIAFAQTTAGIQISATGGGGASKSIVITTGTKDVWAGPIEQDVIISQVSIPANTVTGAATIEFRCPVFEGSEGLPIYVSGQIAPIAGDMGYVSFLGRQATSGGGDPYMWYRTFNVATNGDVYFKDTNGYFWPQQGGDPVVETTNVDWTVQNFFTVVVWADNANAKFTAYSPSLTITNA